MTTLDYIALGAMYVVIQLAVTVLIFLVVGDRRADKREREAVSRGYARKLYNKDSYGVFRWIETDENGEGE